MLVWLIAILIVALVSLFFNSVYIFHELGWFPGVKFRDKPTIQRKMTSMGRIPTIEESRRNNFDFGTQSPYSISLRRYAHREFFEYEDPGSKLRKVLNDFKREPTPSHRDDLLVIMNIISVKDKMTKDIEMLIEEAISVTQEYELKKIKEEG